MGSSKKDLRSFPKPVKYSVGHDLNEINYGRKPKNIKKFKGLRGVMEIIKDYDTDTYRAVYIANIGNRIYVLHCFKKKSKSGIATPPKDINLIKQRFKEAIELNKKGV